MVSDAHCNERLGKSYLPYYSSKDNYGNICYSPSVNKNRYLQGRCLVS